MTLTILREATKHVGHNIVYVSVNNYEDFGLTLANPLSVDMDCKNTPLTLKYSIVFSL